MMRSCWTETPLVWLDVLECMVLWLMNVETVCCGGHMGLILKKFLNKAPPTEA